VTMYKLLQHKFKQTGLFNRILIITYSTAMSNHGSQTPWQTQETIYCIVNIGCIYTITNNNGGEYNFKKLWRL